MHDFLLAQVGAPVILAHMFSLVRVMMMVLESEWLRATWLTN
jgi:hypothetical protein